MTEFPSEVKVAEASLIQIFACLNLEDLWRRLVARVDEERACKHMSAQEEIVLDIHVDGVRYTLTRSIVEDAQPDISLSPREKEIVRLVAKGLPNKVISDVLDISPWTVATYLRRIFSKLGVTSRAEMVACALKARLLEDHPHGAAETHQHQQMQPTPTDRQDSIRLR